jgi:nucleoside phosphorylase
MPVEVGEAVVLTALDVEYEAVQEQLLEATERPLGAGGISYGVGVVRGASWEWNVTVAEIGEGNTAAAVECQRAIAQVHPQLVLFIGVAGSLRPDEVQVGDIVVATKVATFHGGRDDGQFHARPTTYPCSYEVIHLARVLRRADQRDVWLRRLRPQPPRLPSVHVKPVAAGEVVVASATSAVREFLSTHVDDAVAVEMESAGMLHAAHAAQVPAAVVRGISDVLVDRGRADRREQQRLAARSAAAFAIELLARLDPRRPSPSRPEESEDRGDAAPDARSDHNIEAVVYNEKLIGDPIYNINYGPQGPRRDR